MDFILRLSIYILLCLIMYMDINKKYISNFLNIFLFGLSILKRSSELEIFLIGSAIYNLPLLFLYGYGSDFLNKDVIGFGDIKLVFSLGGLLYKPAFNLFLQLYIFYFITFLSASIFILFLFIYKFFKKNLINNSIKGYQIAFSPFLITAFILENLFLKELGDIIL